MAHQQALSDADGQPTYGPAAEGGLSAKRPRGSVLHLTLMSDSGYRGEGRDHGGSPPTGPVTCIIHVNEPDKDLGGDGRLAPSTNVSGC